MPIPPQLYLLLAELGRLAIEAHNNRGMTEIQATVELQKHEMDLLLEREILGLQKDLYMGVIDLHKHFLDRSLDAISEDFRFIQGRVAQREEELQQQERELTQKYIEATDPIEEVKFITRLSAITGDLSDIRNFYKTLLEIRGQLLSSLQPVIEAPKDFRRIK